MDEYIDRDKIINRICNEKCRTEYGKCQKGRDGNKVILCVCDFIRLQEAADVAPVVHGRWIRPHWRNDVHCMDCSECGGEAHHQEFHGAEKYYSMCPHCGARMDGTEATDEVQR